MWRHTLRHLFLYVTYNTYKMRSRHDTLIFHWSHIFTWHGSAGKSYRTWPLERSEIYMSLYFCLLLVYEWKPFLYTGLSHLLLITSHLMIKIIQSGWKLCSSNYCEKYMMSLHPLWNCMASSPSSGLFLHYTSSAVCYRLSSVFLSHYLWNPPHRTVCDDMMKWWRCCLSAGHVGAPLPCNLIKLVDVAEKNYFAAKGEGEVCYNTVCVAYARNPKSIKDLYSMAFWNSAVYEAHGRRDCNRKSYVIL